MTKELYSEVNLEEQHCKSQCAKYSKMLLALAFTLLVWLNLSTYFHIKIEKQQLSKIMNNILTPSKYELQDQFILSKQLRRQIIKLSYGNTYNKQNAIEYKNLDKQIIPKLAYERIKIGQPKSLLNNAQNISLWVISKSNKGYLDKYCSVINGINGITTHTVYTITNLLLIGHFNRIILYINVYDKHSKTLLIENFKMSNLFQISNVVLPIDSDYKFISKPCNNCHKIMYLFSNFIIKPNYLKNIKHEIDNLQQFSMYYSSKAVANETEIINLQNIQINDLQKIEIQQFYYHLYIFDKEFLSYISPLNFAYFTRYTLEQLIILPILSLVQQSGHLFTNDALMYELNPHGKYIQYEQYRMQAPQSQKNALCFVSYPSNPQFFKPAQFGKYFNSIIQNYKNKTSISLIVYLPYKFGRSEHLYNVVYKIHQLLQNSKSLVKRVRFRVLANKTVSSYAVYDAVYGYCPQKSLMVSSRHNVKFHKDFCNELLTALSLQKHYYHTAFINQTGQVVRFQQMPLYINKFEVRKSNLFQQHFRHFQIYKSDFLKANLFWVLKSAELDFYETQSPFVILMLQETRLDFQYINKPLVTVFSRNQSIIQKQQIQNVKKYAEYFALIGNKIDPYPYSCLQNRAFARNAPDKIQRIIHQIWLSKTETSPIRIHLRNTIIQKNPTFEVKLWKFENLTKQNFPYTYYLSQRTLQYHKQSTVSYLTLVADLLRYELIYKQGGIYIDYKMQGLKPLDGFLKYQVFFLDCDISHLRFKDPKVVGLGVMGGVKNSYYFKNIIHEMIYEANFDYKQNIPRTTGSFISRSTFNTEELFTVLGLGYQLLYPLPYQEIVNQCGGVNKTFDYDQTVYIIQDFQSQLDIKIGIPCKEYPQSYLVSYAPLSKTWLFAKRDNN